jgi:hypothetical protein
MPLQRKSCSAIQTTLKRLSGFLIQQAADKVSVASVNDNTHIRLHFDH